MRFDDRLSTVLAQAATDPHDRVVRWRQLVELLARARGTAGPQLDEALAVVRVGAGEVGEEVRAATVRAISALPAPAALVALFAADTVHVAAPLLAAASLEVTEWRQVFDSASRDNRRFLLALHPELEPSPPAAAPEATLRPIPALEPADSHIPSISEVVARIERLRQSREGASPRSRASSEAGAGSERGEALFRWECDPSGEIAWVDGAPRGALVGRSIAQPSDEDGADPAIARALAMRAPFRDASLVLAGDADWSGEWRISGIPAFEPSDGRFAGYRGIATRSYERRGGGAALPTHWADHDSLRELVHEIKTPLNAIIGFAEIIDGQFLGPADTRYRERAAEIVAQARLLLAAIDDLDMAARLQSGHEQAGEPVAVEALIERAVGDVQDRAAQRGVEIGFEQPDSGAACAVRPMLAERLLRRLAETLVEAAAPGERLRLRTRLVGDRCAVVADLPEALRGPSAEPGGAGDFRLHLLGGLARLAGGESVAAGSQLTLTLPRA